MPWYNCAAHSVSNGRVREKFRTKSKSTFKKKLNWLNEQGVARPTGGLPLIWACCRIKSPKWTDETVNYIHFYSFILLCWFRFIKCKWFCCRFLFFVCYGNICWHAKNWQAIWCKKATNLTNDKAPAAVSSVVVYGIWTFRTYMLASKNG